MPDTKVTALSHLIFIILWSRCLYYHHFTDEETETHSSKQVVQSHKITNCGTCILKNIYFMYLFGCADSSLQHMESIFACHLSFSACGSSSPMRDETQPPALRARRNLATGSPGESKFQCILSCATITPHLVSEIFHHPQQSWQPPRTVPS